MKIKGVDISSYQCNCNYAALKASGVKFAIIKAGERWKTDSEVDNHVKGCEGNGIDYGFYWFSHATNAEEAIKEAECCINVISAYNRPLYPVFYDIEAKQQEELDNKTITNIAVAFCEKLNSSGYYSGIYASASWLGRFDMDLISGKYDIWIAHWTGDPNIPTEYDFKQTMWQWGLDTFDGRKIDGDICYVNYPAKILKFYKKNNVSVEKDTVSQTPDIKVEEIAEFKENDKVRVSELAVFSDGTKPDNWVYDAVFDVMQLSRDKSQALIGTEGKYTGWVFVKDLYLSEDFKNVEAVTILKQGDIVKLKSNAKTYDGKKFADWVYYKRFFVDSVNGDRVVINKSPDNNLFAINSPVNIKDLIKL